MLQSFRDNLKGAVAKGVIALMIIPFAMFGVDSLFLSDGQGTDVAVVEGEAITENELAQAIYLQKQQLLSRFGDQAPAEFLTDERLRAPVLEELIRRRLSLRLGQQGGMAASSLELDQMILSAEQFHVEGQFNAQLYTQTLRSLGFTPSTYKKLLGEELVLNQLARGFASTGFTTGAELSRAAVLQAQTRDFYYLTIVKDAIEEATSISDEALAAYYEANQAQFMAPQQLAIEYIEVSPELLSANVTVSEEDVRGQYEQNLASFEVKPERQAAHILLEPKDDGSHIGAAEAVVARLAAGEDFAALAEEVSNDTVSAEQGGDLGYTAGDIFPAEFEAALAELEVGAVSAPVETEAGLHIIKLLAIQDADAPSFEEEQLAIRQTLIAAAAEEQFVEMLDSLGDLTYNADTLAEAGDTLDLPVNKSALFSRQGGEGITANARVLEAAFSDEVLLEGNTSDLIELADNLVVVLRITENKPSQVKSLADVSEGIAAQLKEEAIRATLQSQADNLQLALEQGADFESLAKENSLEWQVTLATTRSDFKVDRTLLNYAFNMAKPLDEAATIGGVFLNNGDYALVSLNKVHGGDLKAMSELQQKQISQGLSRSAGEMEYAVLEAQIKNTADVEVY